MRILKVKTLRNDLAVIPYECFNMHVVLIVVWSIVVCYHDNKQPFPFQDVPHNQMKQRQREVSGSV